ncbi:MAG: hypothetical protein ACRES4_07270 [Nevskiales bacterium]
MVQLIMTLAVVAALVYFVLFRTGSQTGEEPAKPYAAEVEKAKQVEEVLQQTQQQQQRQIDVQLEPRQVDEPAGE